MKETPCYDIYRSTISRTQPGPVNEGKWLSCHIARMIQDWVFYADKHRQRYESRILEDGVLGPAWEAIGRGLRELLNGEILVDAATADTIIVGIFRHEGLEL